MTNKLAPVWQKFRHNGVAFPNEYQPQDLKLVIGGKRVDLTPLAEEMAYQFAKKKDTPYVKDPVFVANFMQDFAKELPPEYRKAGFGDIDFSEFYGLVDQEKRRKEAMGKEEKKSLASQRKVLKEQLKQKFGHAVVDGKEVEIANWMVEPPGLFMGRGCVSRGTIVKTIQGPKYVEELQQGDMIAVHHGSEYMFYKPVASVSQQGVRLVYLLRTRTHTIRATDNHPFLALRVSKTNRRGTDGRFPPGRDPVSLAWVRLSNLRRGDHVVTVKRYQTQGTSKFSKSPKRTFGNAIITQKFARLLGYYVGDGFIQKRGNGTSAHISFAEGHSKLIERYLGICETVLGIAPTLVEHSGGNSYVLQVYSAEFANVFESMGITGTALTKRIPGWIFDLANDLKVAFVRGYLDADGHFFIKKIRDVEYGSFGFESPNRRLIEDLRELSVSAGLQVSNISFRKGHGFTPSGQYRFFINEYLSVRRLLDPDESIAGDRKRYYSLDSRSNSLRTKWDWSRLQILDSQLFGLERVLEIRETGKARTYDVSMADTKNPNFIADGFVVHNSHPLRGHWKPRVTQKDVIVNLSEDVPVPEGWGKIVNDHESVWFAKWIDKLTGKEKYVWPHESSHIQQSRNMEKYDKAARLKKNMEKIRAKILKSMSSRNPMERKTATVCYLIDKLGMRVGDEKDEDEADTVGATTLRFEHLKISEGLVQFDFLGKDSVRWVKPIDRPEPVLVKNLKEFIRGKSNGDEVFDGISSRKVNAFFSGIVAGLTAKVFRTHHATAITESYLKATDAKGEEDVIKKYHAKMANLQAAIFCNHKRTPPKNWDESLKKKEELLREYESKGKEERIKKMKMDIDLAVKTKEYNLNTSLKNYIDPRVYKAWCDYVGLDWTKLYTKSLQRKFEWVEGTHGGWNPPVQVVTVARSESNETSEAVSQP